MKTALLLSLLLSFGLFSFGQTRDSQGSNRQDLSILKGEQEAPMLGIHWARGFNPAARALKGSNPDMTYHGGVIMPSTVSEAIFWGSKWSNSSFVGDKITGLDSWYVGFSDSNYAKTSDEYTGSNGQVGPSLTHNGHVIDTSTAASGNSTSAIVAEACKEISNPVDNGYYPVYVDVPRRNAGYCAYHTFGSCHGVTIQVAFFFDLDGDPGCDPQDTSGLHSQGLAADTNSRKLALIRILPALGMIAAAKRTAISALGPSMFPSSCSAMGPSGRFKGSGPITLTTREPATQTAQGREDVSTVTEVSR